MYWRGATTGAEFEIMIEDSAVLEIDRLCGLAHPQETGGILIGKYSNDRTTAIVMEATAPPVDSKRGRSWFRRGVDGLQSLLSARWKAEERTFYLGEWHFHPASDVDPSPEDFDQMSSIARTKKYQCSEPLMLIFCNQKDARGSRTFRAFVHPLNQKTMELVECQ